MSRPTQSANDKGQNSLEDIVYLRMRHGLVNGMFKAGERLSIRQIAAQLGTSSMPVRSALRRLTAEQALDVHSSGTTIVPRLTRAAFTEISNIRVSLEPMAVRMAVPNIDAHTRDMLADLAQQQLQLQNSGDPESMLRLDREFLMALYSRARAPLLSSIIEQTWLRRGPIFWEARWILASFGETVSRHSEIVSAIDCKDADLAAELLRQEISETTTYLLERIEFEGDPTAQQLEPIDREKS